MAASNEGIYKRGSIWWIKYSCNGKPFRESSGSKLKTVAKLLRDKRMGEIAQGKIPGIQFDKVTFSQLAEDFIRDYQINQKKSLARAERSVRHLKSHFEGWRVQSITSSEIKKFITERLGEGAANASINRELSALKRMLNLGAQQTPPLVDKVPHIPMLKENNTRKGFFEHNNFLALRDALPAFLKGFVTFAYKTGWRFTEITCLTWSQVDMKQGILRLEVGETKNNEGRTIYLDDELKEVFHIQWKLRKEKGILIPYVFTNEKGTGPVKDIRGSWFKALEKVGMERKLFHDFRRSAVRNMIRSGIPERVAMMISGHKTRSVFDRYNIVNGSALKEAANQQAEYLQKLKGTISGTVTQAQEKTTTQNTD